MAGGGSLQTPAGAGGRTQPHLRGRPPLPGTPRERHGARASARAPLVGRPEPGRGAARQHGRPQEPREPPLRGRPGALVPVTWLEQPPQPCLQGPGAAPGDQARDTCPEHRAGTLAAHQHYMPGSGGADPGPGYRRVTGPILPLSASAPSSQSRGKAGCFPHLSVVAPYLWLPRAPLTLLGSLSYSALLCLGQGGG